MPTYYEQAKTPSLVNVSGGSSTTVKNIMGETLANMDNARQKAKSDRINQYFRVKADKRADDNILYNRQRNKVADDRILKKEAQVAADKSSLDMYNADLAGVDTARAGSVTDGYNRMNASDRGKLDDILINGTQEEINSTVAQMQGFAPKRTRVEAAQSAMDSSRASPTTAMINTLDNRMAAEELARVTDETNYATKLSSQQKLADKAELEYKKEFSKLTNKGTYNAGGTAKGSKQSTQVKNFLTALKADSGKGWNEQNDFFDPDAVDIAEKREDRIADIVKSGKYDKNQAAKMVDEATKNQLDVVTATSNSDKGKYAYLKSIEALDNKSYYNGNGKKDKDTTYVDALKASSDSETTKLKELMRKGLATPEQKEALQIKLQNDSLSKLVGGIVTTDTDKKVGEVGKTSKGGSTKVPDTITKLEQKVVVPEVEEVGGNLDNVFVQDDNAIVNPEGFVAPSAPGSIANKIAPASEPQAGYKTLFNSLSNAVTKGVPEAAQMITGPIKDYFADSDSTSVNAGAALLNNTAASAAEIAGSPYTAAKMFTDWMLTGTADGGSAFTRNAENARGVAAGALAEAGITNPTSQQLAIIGSEMLVPGSALFKAVQKGPRAVKLAMESDRVRKMINSGNLLPAPGAIAPLPKGFTSPLHKGSILDRAPGL